MKRAVSRKLPEFGFDLGVNLLLKQAEPISVAIDWAYTIVVVAG